MPAAAPFDLQLVLTRCNQAPLLADAAYHLVDYAANNAAAIEARDFLMPALFIVEPMYTAAGASDSPYGSVIDPHEYEVGFVTAVQNLSGTLGNAQSQSAQALRALLWQQIVGWSPEAPGFEFYIGRGQLLSFDEQCFFYLDTFVLRRIGRNL